MKWNEINVKGVYLFCILFMDYVQGKKVQHKILIIGSLNQFQEEPYHHIYYSVSSKMFNHIQN